jgi:hypothetical protein
MTNKNKQCPIFSGIYLYITPPTPPARHDINMKRHKMNDALMEYPMVSFLLGRFTAISDTLPI